MIIGLSCAVIQLILTVVFIVMLNRLDDPRFPDTISGILTDGGYGASPVSEADLASARWALQVAVMGVDPTNGALYWARSDTADAADLIPHLTVGKRVFGVRAKEVGGEFERREETSAFEMVSPSSRRKLTTQYRKAPPVPVG